MIEDGTVFSNLAKRPILAVCGCLSGVFQRLLLRKQTLKFDESATISDSTETMVNIDSPLFG
jgi:hypothetical protein